MDLSIIIINHNTKKLTTDAVNAIHDSRVKYSYEVIVVDNSDREEQQFQCEDSRVVILPNVENRGFAHGCNEGFRVSKGEYVLFLNSDTLMQENTLNQSITYLKEHANVGGLCVRLENQYGEFDHGCKRGFPTPWNAFCYYSRLDRIFPKWKSVNGYCLRYLDDAEPHEVDAVSGAYLMMPRSVYEKTGGFDETFFMYGEDLDLCYKIHEQGYSIVYNPLVKCIHLKGKSGKDNPMVRYHFYYAMILFYDRYYQNKHSGLTNGLVKIVLNHKVKQYAKRMENQNV